MAIDIAPLTWEKYQAIQQIVAIAVFFPFGLVAEGEMRKGGCKKVFYLLCILQFVCLWAHLDHHW
jgi:hypothetical protein